MGTSDLGLALASVSQDEGFSSSFTRRLKARAGSSAELSSASVYALLSSSLESETSSALSTKAQSPQEWIAALTPSQTETLEKVWGKEKLPQFLSLAKEPNAELFQLGLLNLGRGLVEDQRPQAAASIFSLLQNQKEFPKIAADAEQEMNILQGKASFGASFGYLAP